MARPGGEGTVSVPLGLIALNWLRLYKPLVQAGLPQTPTNKGAAGLGFAKEGWRRIEHLSALDLRVGAQFSGETSEAVHAALGDAARTVANMPATHMTFPGTSGPVMRADKARAGAAPRALLIDEAYLRRFGKVHIPVHLCRALSRYDAWIEPALVSEWILVMRSYAERQGRALDPSDVARAMEWSQRSRDVGFARGIALDLHAGGHLRCVWSGGKLTAKALDIDHCLPWSAWPCEDLWNLLPAHPSINRHQKRQRLPSAAALHAARALILDWWNAAYVRRDEATRSRFLAEATSSLPVQPGGLDDLEAIFAGLAARRTAL